METVTVSSYITEQTWEVPEVLEIDGQTWAFVATGLCPARGDIYWAASLQRWVECYFPHENVSPVIVERWRVRKVTTWERML